MSDKKTPAKLLVVALLIVATVALYWPVHKFVFLGFDDGDYMTENPDVKAGLTADSIKWAFGLSFAGNWHPVTWLSHMLDCQLFGVESGPHHLVNVALHAANAVLLFLFLCRFTKALWRSAFVAGVFALHPVHVESVAWISERKDVLSLFFFVLTLWAWCGYAEARAARPQRSGRLSYVLALVFCALGLMSKPMLVTLPCVLLLMDVWPMRRLSLDAKTLRPAALLPFVVEKIPFFLFSAVSCVLTVVAQSRGGAVATTEIISIQYRIVNALASYLKYIGKIFWPAKLSAFYPLPNQMEYGLAALSLGIIIGVAALAWKWRQSRPYLVTGWLWYVGTLVPVIGLIQVGTQGMADRYTYIPSIGLTIAFVWLVADWVGSNRAGQAGLAVAGVAVLCACVPLTARQVMTWKDTETVFDHARKVTERNYVALTMLGGFLENDGKQKEAIPLFEEAITYAPHYAGAWFGLATAQCLEGNTAEGMKNYETAIQLSPADPQIRNAYAVALINQNRTEEAEKVLRETLAIRPNWAQGHLHLGVVLGGQGKMEEAMQHYEAAVRYKPEADFTHNGYAEALLKARLVPQAIEEFQIALKLNPKLVEARRKLAGALVENNQIAAAAEQYSAVLAVSPTNAYALDGMGYTLAMRNRIDEAMPYFVKSLELVPTNGFAQFHIAMNYQAKGDVARSLEHLRLAVKYSPDLVGALNNLAWTLSTAPEDRYRNGPEAVGYAERACAISEEKEPFFLGTLGCAYAETGRFDDAIRAAEKAIAVGRANNLPLVVERNTYLLGLYRDKKPYRDIPPPAPK